MLLQSCTIEEIDEELKKGNVDVVMTKYFVASGGKIGKNHTVICVDKGSKDWFKECLDSYRRLFGEESLCPHFGMIIYENEIKEINGSG